MDLTDVPIDQLVAEVSRRMHCLDKPEKRVIMVGKLIQNTFARCEFCLSVNYNAIFFIFTRVRQLRISM